MRPPPSRKLTVPVADDGDMVALSVTGCPSTGAKGRSAMPVEVAFFTLTRMPGATVTFSASPEYSAEIETDPSGNAVVRDATPDERVAVPATEPLTVN